MRRNLSILGLVGTLIIAVIFALWEAGWYSRNISAGGPAAQGVSSDPELIETHPLTLAATDSAVAPNPGASSRILGANPTCDPTALCESEAAAPTPSSPSPVKPSATPEPDDLLTLGKGILTPAPPAAVNDVQVDQFVVMPDSVKENVRKIYAQGQTLGNNPRAFSKIGDSTIENPYFLTRFDDGPYKLGDYRYLQSVVDYFAGSFGRQSMAVRIGLHSWSALNATWADKTTCKPNETPVGCEFRLHKPSIVFIHLGANDTDTPKFFKENMQKLVEFCVQSGVIPILSTKADRFKDPENAFNKTIRELAAENQVPLWDFDLVAETLPGRGLGEDNVHMTSFYSHDYTLPEAFQRGHSVHNLTALIVLDRVWKEITQADR
jgi:GDSL-like Lipase/Acylhydrolase